MSYGIHSAQLARMPSVWQDSVKSYGKEASSRLSEHCLIVLHFANMTIVSVTWKYQDLIF